ncbi:hypothetical protein GCM10027570_37170 [Streptomonospora sediminis]
MDAVLSVLTNPYKLIQLVFLVVLAATVVNPEFSLPSQHRRALEAKPRLRTAVLWGYRIAAVLGMGAVVIAIAA